MKKRILPFLLALTMTTPVLAQEISTMKAPPLSEEFNIEFFLENLFSEIDNQEYGERYEDIAFKTNKYTVKIDNNKVEFKDDKGNDIDIINYDDEIYVPIRALTQVYGKELKWEDETKTIIISGEPTIKGSNPYKKPVTKENIKVTLCPDISVNIDGVDTDFENTIMYDGNTYMCLHVLRNFMFEEAYLNEKTNELILTSKSENHKYKDKVSELLLNLENYVYEDKYIQATQTVIKMRAIKAPETIKNVEEINKKIDELQVQLKEVEKSYMKISRIIKNLLNISNYSEKVLTEEDRKLLLEHSRQNLLLNKKMVELETEITAFEENSTTHKYDKNVTYYLSSLRQQYYNAVFSQDDLGMALGFLDNALLEAQAIKDIKKPDNYEEEIKFVETKLENIINSINIIKTEMTKQDKFLKDEMDIKGSELVNTQKTIQERISYIRLNMDTLGEEVWSRLNN